VRREASAQILFHCGDNLAIEVKSTRNLQDKHLKGLEAFCVEGIFRRHIVVCREEHPHIEDGIVILTWQFFLDGLYSSMAFPLETHLPKE